MFELSIACKYLMPRWRQLSVSLISLISVLVIALVVWLVVVFFSVTNGLEKSWIQKLIALTAPIRITPTEAYYKSYYYLSDSVSAASQYSTKSIREKLETAQSDPYDPSTDEELPQDWPMPDKSPDGALKDPVKEAFRIIRSLHLAPSDFELAGTHLRIRLENKESAEPTYLSQSAFIGTFDPENTLLLRTQLPLTDEEIAYMRAKLGEGINPSDYPLKQEGQKVSLPPAQQGAEPVLLPRSFREAGIHAGDRGYLGYYAATASSVQEQRLPIYVAGFYDPGIIPLGGKYAIASPEVVSLIHSSFTAQDHFVHNGINVRFKEIDRSDAWKSALVQAFEEAGIAPYWNITTYREFEFTKDLLQQLRSEKNLWTLLATVIIIVACSNIISMLIILVNDKKLEIGILRAMGATSKSIAMIFGFCGMLMGMLGSTIGMIAALITLSHLQTLVDFIGTIQGYEMFNPLFYGNALPNEISFDAILFVVVTTTCLSFFAGIVPALKASLLRPSTILRSE